MPVDTPATPAPASASLAPAAAGETDTATLASAAAMLGLQPPAVLALMNNTQFPAPVSNDGDGNITWNAADISAFAAAMTAAANNRLEGLDRRGSLRRLGDLGCDPTGPYYSPLLPAPDPLWEVCRLGEIMSEAPLKPR